MRIRRDGTTLDWILHKRWRNEFHRSEFQMQGFEDRVDV
jgi:hypothetical protein